MTYGYLLQLEFISLWQTMSLSLTFNFECFQDARSFVTCFNSFQFDIGQMTFPHIFVRSCCTRKTIVVLIRLTVKRSYVLAEAFGLVLAETSKDSWTLHLLEVGLSGQRNRIEPDFFHLSILRQH